MHLVELYGQQLADRWLHSEIYQVATLRKLYPEMALRSSLTRDTHDAWSLFSSEECAATEVPKR